MDKTCIMTGLYEMGNFDKTSVDRIRRGFEGHPESKSGLSDTLENSPNTSTEEKGRFESCHGPCNSIIMITSFSRLTTTCVSLLLLFFRNLDLRQQLWTEEVVLNRTFTCTCDGSTTVKTP